MKLIESSFKHDSYKLDDLSFNCPWVYVKLMLNNEQKCLAFMDFSTWPPQALPLPNSIDNIEFIKTWSPFYLSENNNIWKKNINTDTKNLYEHIFQFEQLVSPSPWQTKPIGNLERLLHQFFEIHTVKNDTILHVDEVYDAKGKCQYEILKVSQNATESWYQSRRGLRVFSFPHSDNYLIIEDNKRYAVANGALQPDDFIDFLIMPYAHAYKNEFLCVSQDTFVYFSCIKRPHSGHSNGPEWILQLNRINYQTNTLETALIDGFGSLQTQTIFDRASKKNKKIKRSNFDGNLQACQGHGAWWVFNYLSNSLGSLDIACFWNDQTNETFTLSQADFKACTPTIVFIKALGRYLANDNDSVSLLIDFDAIYACKQKAIMTWVAQPALLKSD